MLLKTAMTFWKLKKNVRELKFYEQLAKESSKIMNEWL